MKSVCLRNPMSSYQNKISSASDPDYRFLTNLSGRELRRMDPDYSLNKKKKFYDL